LAGHAVGTPEYANDLNTRAYSQSEKCVYAQMSLDLEHVRRLADRSPDAVDERRRRPFTLWIGGEEFPDGTVEMTGYSVGGIRIERFRVDPRAHEGQPRWSAEDFWE
jgi:hypothetical protein